MTAGWGRDEDDRWAERGEFDRQQDVSALKQVLRAEHFLSLMRNSDDVGKFFEKALRCESDTLIKSMTRRRVTRRQKYEACPALVVGTQNVLSLYFLYNSFYNKKVNNIITFQNFNVLETQLIKSVYCTLFLCRFFFGDISGRRGVLQKFPLL